MTTSCFGGISYDPNRANPEFVVGMEKIRELKDALDFASNTTKACKSLAVQLHSDCYERIIGNQNFFKRVTGRFNNPTYQPIKEEFEACYRSLDCLQEFCQRGKDNLNHFEKNFVKQCSRISAGEITSENFNISREINNLATLGSDFYQKAQRLASTAQWSLDQRMKYNRTHFIRQRQAVHLKSAIEYVDYISRTIRERRI